MFGAYGLRVYQHEDNPLTPQQAGRGIVRKLIPGFPMTAHTKRGLVDRLADRIDSFQTGTPDRRMVNQGQSYIVTERMTTEAEAGGHDDLVYVWAGCVMLAESPGAKTVRETDGLRSRSNVRWLAPVARR